MLQDIPTPTLREACPCVLETERLTLRRPTLADVKAIARLANDRRIAENTRRLPHPYSEEHAIDFVRHVADTRDEVAFLIEHNFEPVGAAGIHFRTTGFRRTRLLARLRALGPGFWDGNRTRGDRLFLRGVRPRAAATAAPASPTRCRATSWRSAASSGPASSCTASRRSARRARSTASACRAACGRR